MLPSDTLAALRRGGKAPRAKAAAFVRNKANRSSGVPGLHFW